jgi:hypothetical protein
MQVIWPMEANYNCEKKQKNDAIIQEPNTNSFRNCDCEYSIELVAIIDNGKNVKIKTSLLLFGESIKMAVPIKKANTIFLYDA